MRLGLTTGYSGAKLSLNIDLIQEAERLGFDSVWTAEAYGSDAISSLAWIGALTSKIKLGTAIANLYTRVPADYAGTTAMIHELSGGVQPKVNIYFNVVHTVDGAWNLDGKAMSNDELGAAITKGDPGSPTDDRIARERSWK